MPEQAIYLDDILKVLGWSKGKFEYKKPELIKAGNAYRPLVITFFSHSLSKIVCLFGDTVAIGTKPAVQPAICNEFEIIHFS